MTSNIIDLARTILNQVEVIDAALKGAGQPDLSAGLGGGQIPPTDGAAQTASLVAKGAARQLAALLNGPRGIVYELSGYKFDLGAIQVINRFQIANTFPVGETATYADIAKRCGLPEDRVRRILRFAMTSDIFVEVKPEVVAHTALSEALAQDFTVRAEAAQAADEQFPAVAHLAESLEKYGPSEEPVESGWAIANRASRPMFAELQAKYPKRANQFSTFMDLWATQHSTQPLLDMVDWNAIASTTTLPKPRLVDIGGGKGHVCFALAQALPDFTFTVQDYPSTIAGAQAVIPADLRDRVTYQAHDFILDVQPVHGADVYYFRSIFHDWPDKYCVQILRNLIPALRPGSRIILNEMCLTSTRLIPPLERVSRGLDLVMMTLFNGQERSEEDFRRIVSQADDRFGFVSIKEPVLDPNGLPKKGLLSIIELVWRGSETEH